MPTCANCKFFEPSIVLLDGVCLKGHGWKEKTSQGLPAPKVDTGYVLWFNRVCEEDFCPE